MALTNEEIGVLLRLLDKQRFVRDTKDAGQSVKGIGDSADRASRRAGRAFSIMGRGLNGVARAAKYGAAVGIAAATLEAKRAIEAFEESRKVGAQTDAVLRSTGGGANVTRREIDEMTDALSRQSGIDDEAIQGAQNLLLTFRQVRNEVGRGNDVFSQAVPLVVDMATAMGMDLNAAALQFGKALNDPLKGMTRLSRVGIEFTEQQQQQIKDYAELGDIQAAQRVMLRELAKQFGGSAAAQATALGRLSVSWGNVEESIGAALSPLTDFAASKLDVFMDHRLGPAIDRLSRRTEGVFRREDLDFGEKLVLAAREARREVSPFQREIAEFLRDADLGERFQDAVEWGAPKIADGFANAAPKAAEAFVNAWLNAGPWGKLVTVAFLASKMGAFRGVGGVAAGYFGTGFRRDVPGELRKSRGAFRNAGGVMGGVFGRAFLPAAAAYLGYELGREYGDEIGKGLRDAINAISPGSVPENGRADMRDVLAAAPGSAAEVDRATREYRRSSPPMNPQVTSRGQGGVPVVPGAAVTRRPRSPLSPAAPGRPNPIRPIVVQTPVKLTMDGQVVAEAVARRELRLSDLDD